MSQAHDYWMTLGKRRLCRRATSNGPYGPPAGTETYSGLTVPSATKVRGTVSQAPTAFTVGKLVAFVPRYGTGSAAAYNALNALRAVVDTVASPVVTFSTAPTDLTGISLAGCVIDVILLN